MFLFINFASQWQLMRFFHAFVAKKTICFVVASSRVLNIPEYSRVVNVFVTLT